jgi:hypothetical protein
MFSNFLVVKCLQIVLYGGDFSWDLRFYGWGRNAPLWKTRFLVEAM